MGAFISRSGGGFAGGFRGRSDAVKLYGLAAVLGVASGVYIFDESLRNQQLLQQGQVAGQRQATGQSQELDQRRDSSSEKR
jgi:hypothetical protein